MILYKIQKFNKFILFHLIKVATLTLRPWQLRVPYEHGCSRKDFSSTRHLMNVVDPAVSHYCNTHRLEAFAHVQHNTPQAQQH